MEDKHKINKIFLIGLLLHIFKLNSSQLTVTELYNEDDEKCLENLRKKVFLKQRTILHIFDNETIINFKPNETDIFLHFSRFKLSTFTKNINFKIENVIIEAEDFSSINDTINKFKNLKFWNSNAYTIVIMKTATNKVEEIFNIFDKIDLQNSLLLIPEDNSLKLYKSDQYQNGFVCHKHHQAEFVGYCANFTRFFKNSNQIFTKHYKGCDLKISMIGIYYESPLADRYIKPLILIGKKYGFNIIYVPKNYNEYRTTGKTPTIEKDINKREYDIFASIHVRDIYFYEIFDVSDIVFYDKFMWTLGIPGKLSNVKVLLSIFSVHVWISILFIFVIVALFWWIVQIAQNYANNSLIKCILNTYSITLLVAINKIPKRKHLKILIFMYFYYSLNLSYYFQGRLGAILTNPGLEAKYKSLEELVKSDVTIMAYSSMIKGINITERDLAKKLMERILPQPLYELDEMMSLWDNDKKLVMIQREHLISVYPNYQRRVYYVSGQFLLNAENCYLLRKGHPFSNKINRYIEVIHEIGLQKKWLDEIRVISFDKYKEENVILTSQHLQAAYFILFLGYTISFVVFICEIIKIRFSLILSR